jgi:hypothetical protein
MGIFDFLKRPKFDVVETAPQVVDYPRDKYKAYWEIYNHVTNAEVRFMDRTGKVLDSVKVTAHTETEVLQKAYSVVKQKMENYKV